MYRSKLLIAIALLIGIAVTGFQCSSTELTSAKLYIQQKNYDKAIEALQKEVQKNPKSDEGYYLLGVVQGEKDNYSEMIDAFNKSLAISDKFKSQINDQKKFYWANLFNKGVKNFQNGTNSQNDDSAKVFFDKSINAFQYAVQLEPDSADTYKNLAFVYLSAGKYDEAVEPLQKLIDKEKSADGYRYLGEIYYNKGQQLKDQYKTSENTQDSVQAQEYYNKAISVLEEGRKVHPNNTDILLLLSNSYIAANKISVAIDAFKAGVEQDPENKYYRYNYGVLLLGSEKYEQAVEQFKKAVEIDPEYQNAIYNLAVSYVKWGTVLSKENEDAENPNMEYKEKYKLALPYLEKVVEMRTDDAATWELLGRVYTVLNMNDKATNAFNKADELRK